MSKAETPNLEKILGAKINSEEFFTVPEFSLLHSDPSSEVDEKGSIKKIESLRQKLGSLFPDEKTGKRLLASASILAEVEKIFVPVKEKLKGASKDKSLILRQSTEAEIVRFQAELESCKALVVELFSETQTAARRMHWDGATAGGIKACQLLLGEFARLGVHLSLAAASAYPDLNLQRLGSNVFKLSGLLLELGGDSRAATEDIVSSLGVK